MILFDIKYKRMLTCTTFFNDFLQVSNPLFILQLLHDLEGQVHHAPRLVRSGHLLQADVAHVQHDHCIATENSLLKLSYWVSMFAQAGK